MPMPTKDEIAALNAETAKRNEEFLDRLRTFNIDEKLDSVNLSKRGTEQKIVLQSLLNAARNGLYNLETVKKDLQALENTVKADKDKPLLDVIKDLSAIVRRKVVHDAHKKEALPVTFSGQGMTAAGAKKTAPLPTAGHPEERPRSTHS